MYNLLRWKAMTVVLNMVLTQVHRYPMTMGFSIKRMFNRVQFDTIAGSNPEQFGQVWTHHSSYMYIQWWIWVPLKYLSTSSEFCLNQSVFFIIHKWFQLQPPETNPSFPCVVWHQYNIIESRDNFRISWKCLFLVLFGSVSDNIINNSNLPFVEWHLVA